MSFLVRATGADLSFSVVLNQQVINSFSPASDFQQVNVEFSEDVDQEHVLELIMSGKTDDHTTLDADGNIIEDRVIEIQDFTIDEIYLGHVFVENTRYTHDFNGNGQSTEQDFYGVMGCNGTVTFRFSTPVYLWLLENM